MRVWLFLFVFMFSASAYAEYISPAIDFFMHGRHYDTFLRDYFRFKEPKPLRIEYNYINWLDSGIDAKEYSDYLHLESIIPIYMGQRLLIDIPFEYSRVPVWAETGELFFGDSLHILEPSIISCWVITNRLKSIAGLEYNIKGDGDNFGRPGGKMACLFKGFLSYDIHKKLNFIVGARLDRYYYDPEEKSFKLSDRLYSVPAIMLNWHPDNDNTLLLGIPYTGIHLSFGDMFKIEARSSINKKVELSRVELALQSRISENNSITLRLFNTPYTEIPIKSLDFQDGTPLIGKLFCTDKSACLEVGRILNPAASASLGLQYGIESDVEFKDEQHKNITTLNGKHYYAVGARFIVDMDALFRIR